MLLGVVFRTFEDFRYTDELDSDEVKALMFQARVGDKEIEGLDLMRIDGDGKIADFTVMVRPLSGGDGAGRGRGQGPRAGCSQSA